MTEREKKSLLRRRRASRLRGLLKFIFVRVLGFNLLLFVLKPPVCFSVRLRATRAVVQRLVFSSRFAFAWRRD